jgi:hypothetical protein
MQPMRPLQMPRPQIRRLILERRIRPDQPQRQHRLNGKHSQQRPAPKDTQPGGPLLAVRGSLPWPRPGSWRCCRSRRRGDRGDGLQNFCFGVLGRSVHRPWRSDKIPPGLSLRHRPQAAPPAITGRTRAHSAAPQQPTDCARILTSVCGALDRTPAYESYCALPPKEGRSHNFRTIRIPGVEHGETRPIVHDAGLLNILAPWANAATAAGLLRRQSRLWLALNHTSPSSP